MSVDIKCSYETYNFDSIGETYHCDVQIDPDITSEDSAVISKASGSHECLKTDDDVHGFYVDGKTVKVFPRGLEKIFKNLKLIAIHYGRIEKIHQSDLNPFSQLESLNLAYNDIEVLEKGLFDFNPELKSLSFWNNKISQIHPNVFDHLTKLVTLRLTDNHCIDIKADKSKYEVKGVIKQVKLNCQGSVSIVIESTTEESNERIDDSDEFYSETYHEVDSEVGKAAHSSIHIMLVILIAVGYFFI